MNFELTHRNQSICPPSHFAGSMGWSASLLYRLALLLRKRSAVHQPSDLKRTTDKGRYRSWRYRELQQQLVNHFDPDMLANKDVVDFGCGTGELCQIMAPYRPQSLTGLDVSEKAIQQAVDNSPGLDGNIPHVYIRAQQDDALPLENESSDLVCCFDVAEHIARPSAIAAEWFRVLRPGGRVWIWWSPWCGPFGHHLESLLPLPWIHLLFPERSIFQACAAIYAHPDFIPRHWDIDPETGNKKPNKWLHTTSFYPFLNKLTRRALEAIANEAGFSIVRREVCGFNGSWLRRLTRYLRPIPFIGDCVVSYYIYELEKPHSRSPRQVLTPCK